MDQDTKKKVLIGIWCAAAALLIGAGVFAWIYFSENATFEDKQFKFSLTYPRKWKKIEKYEGTIVTFIRPKKTALDVVSPNVNITVQEVPEHIATMSSFSETIIKQLTAVFGSNIKVVEEKSVRFAGKQGYRIVVWAEKPNNLYIGFTYAMKGPLVYIFTFLGDKQQYKELAPTTIKKMIDSFQIK